ncbi:MAG: DNA replication and repair protein RecF [Gemmatimonadetes bacterium]|nr:DNA replication and repair protein RecF [Gemmatimonadota bacterium]MYH52716.1 DNA replication and repair protein RecF [Gemmatimonadota bacterium]MYK65764.1 DNA replication and repair protein RecF [Gemmatimonadota bacterium]
MFPYVWKRPFAVSSRFVVLRELELRHFRNLEVQELHFPPEGVAVIGDNAQGKTNLLEAIYYLESFRSFRGAGDGELAAFSEDVFYLRGSVEGDRPARVSAGYDRKRKKKKVSVDGTDAVRIAGALGRLGAVVFSPSDVELVSGGPRARRRFLDILLSLNRKGYVEALAGYRKALAQRNAALKANAGAAAVVAWDRGLVEQGARVTHLRHEWATTWSSPFATYCTAISGCDPVAMTYRPNLGNARGGSRAGAEAFGADEGLVRERFEVRLAETRETDAQRGVTTVGPHRDELHLTISSQGRSLPARTFGSGGQRRTAALALRLAEAATIRRERGTEPILLLDDAFAELDEGRSRQVMELLAGEGAGQVVLTAPKESDARLRGPSLERWRIREGVVEA